MMFDRVVLIANSEVTDLVALANLAGADPEYFYWDADFRDVDIRGQNLSGLNLSNATFEGVIANASTSVDRQFRPKLFGAALRRQANVDWRMLSPESLVEHAVLVARAGDAAAALQMVEKLIAQNRLPKYSIHLLRCEEINENVRNRYYRIWAEKYSNDPSAATIWAILGYERALQGIEVDLREFVSRFMELSPEEFDIKDVVTTIIGREDPTDEAVHIISRWLLSHATHGNKLAEVYDYMFVFDRWVAVPLAEAFSVFLGSNLRNRKLGKLIVDGIKYFSKGNRPFGGEEISWLERNLRAEKSREVLISLLNRWYPDRRAASVFVKWTYANKWTPYVEGDLYVAARAYLARGHLSGRSYSTMLKRLDSDQLLGGRT